jgi:glycosyltransferase involved in cell wall biosynthesis
MLSIIIPSRNEQFLSKTVDDIFAKAKGEFEVIVILDEKDQLLIPRPGLRVIKKEGLPGLRSALNQGIDAAQGKYIMKCDAHCMFGEGFDIILSAECEDNWVVIPRRYSLEPKDWSIRTYRPTVDYEYFVYPFDVDTAVKTGGKWHERAVARKDILIDETIAFQGSCWFTTKQHIRNIDGYATDTSTGDEFVWESEELSFKTWLSGGKCMVNKKTWYAHLHKGKEYGRGYFLSSPAMKRQRAFCTDYWMNNKWPKQIYPVEWLIEKFMPMPGWPENWREKIGHSTTHN